MLVPKQAVRVYLALSVVQSLANAVMFTTLAVYYVQRIGLNPLQLVLVGTAIEATVLVFEIPTGIVADLYSRRLSVIIGMALLGIAWTTQGALPLFVAIIGAEIVRGIGETFLSGALDAWLADEVGEEGIGAVYVRAAQRARIAGLLGAGLSVGLATISLRLPVLVGGAMYILLAIGLAVTMPETQFHPGQRTGWRDFTATFRDGARVVRRSRTLTLLLVAGVFLGVASEGFDRLWEAHLLTSIGVPALVNAPPVVWFGLIAIAGELISLATVAVLGSRLERLSTSTVRVPRWLVAGQVIIVVCIAIYALATSFAVAVLVLLLRIVAGSIIWPLRNAWLMQHIEPGVRATTLSMISQTDAIGQTAGGPLVGVIGNRSLRAALFVAALLTAPPIVAYTRAARQPHATYQSRPGSV